MKHHAVEIENKSIAVDLVELITNKMLRGPEMMVITKTCLCNFEPLRPHFYIVKLGFTGVYIISLISAQKHRLCVLDRTSSPRRF